MLPAPLATSDSEELADWLELKAVASADGNSSITDLVREFQRNGTSEECLADAEDEDSDGADDSDDIDIDARSMEIAEDAFAAIEARKGACPSDGAYPFDIDNDSIQLLPNGISSPYLFLLLLGEFGQTPAIKAALKGAKAPKSGTKLFEHLCARAARSYLGPNTMTAVFGFPRDDVRLAKGFSAAVNDLCKLISEGGTCRQSKKVSQEKDGGLDVVAWQPFPDGRKGQLIAFGQCATGGDWKAKATDLLPEAWYSTFFQEAPLAIPLLRLFFLPYVVRDIDWELLSRRAGIVFDRCRIAHCVSQNLDPTDPLRKECSDWVQKVYSTLRTSVADTMKVAV